MLSIKVNSAVEAIRELAISWGGRFTEYYGTSKLELDNDLGKGVMCSYDIMPGLSVFTYDMKFFREVNFETDESLMNPVYFIYCVEGHCFHKFGDEENTFRIAQMQNTVIKSSQNKTNVVKIPANIDLKFSIILIMENRLEEKPSPRREFLTTTLKDVLETVEVEDFYRYFGEINLSIAEHAKVLIKNKRTDAIGRLITEASVLKTLASQLQSMHDSKDHSYQSYALTPNEIDKLLRLNAFISDNISKKLTISQLAKQSGLPPKKLQSGMRYLYGESINIFIKNVKLEYAKDLLENSGMSVSEVSYSIGINSRSYFSKIFKERFGILPIDFSKKFLSNDVLFELSYRSKISDGIDNDDINTILESSRNNNGKNNITGCLIILNNMFFQYIEGPKAEILKLYDVLLKDDRHYDIKLLWKGLTMNRLFEDWNLAMVSDQNELKVKLDGVLKNIKIDQDLKSNDESRTVSGDLLWRRVRNVLKTA